MFRSVPRREKWLRGFLVFCGMHLSLLEVVRIQKHCQILWSCRMSPIGRDGLRWIISFQQIVSDRCFNKDAKGADGAADLLEALSQSTQLENLDLSYCNQIPAAAWQKVRSAKWLNLKKANFNWCLAERKWLRGFLVFCGMHLSLLEVVRIQKHCQICEVVVWVRVGRDGLRWTVSFQQIVSDRCFNKDAKGADGAADLLQALSQWDTAGRVGFLQLFADPSSSVAKSS